jgi:HEAT repeat protein
MALGWLGPAAKPAIPDLVNALGDNFPFVASSAAHVLSGLGPSTRDALPAIVTHLRVRDSFAAANVAELIVKIAGESPDTVSSLTPMLREPDEIKTRVLRLLPKLGRPAVAASSQIEPLMDSTNVSVRFAAIAALWDLVPARQFELLPKLEEFATSPNQNIRVETGLKLVRMQPLTARAAELLAAVAGTTGNEFRWQAFTRLRDRGREASNAVPILVAHLNAEEPRVAARAAEALGEIARPADNVLDALEKAKKHEQLMIADAATAAIRTIKSKAD